MDINEILNLEDIESIIKELTAKSVSIRPWEELKKEYYPEYHPVMDKTIYRDRGSDGKDKVTRITYDLQRLATSRASELCFGIPVKRIYDTQTENHKKIAKYIEAIFKRARIDSVNLERARMLFAGCEVCTIWYGVMEKNHIYGFESNVRLRCRNFSPMLGDELYPLFDEYGDMVAMSVKYTRKKLDKDVTFFDTYTKNRHLLFQNEDGKWEAINDEHIGVGKIPAVYVHRPTPIWENTSNVIYEMEWTMSRNGNYIRKNSKPIFTIFCDSEPDDMKQEKSENEEDRAILQFPVGSSAQYCTWNQSVESIRYQMQEMRQSFFTELQLPDWSYESMKSTPMSAESRRQLFIDAQLKVKDESGRLLEFLDREVNVIKSFLKLMLPENLGNEIDSLLVESEITPFTINDEEQTIRNLILANGNQPLISHLDSIKYLGWSNDADKTYSQIKEEQMQSSMQMAQ